MRRSAINRFRPGLERLESKELLSGGGTPNTYVLDAVNPSGTAAVSPANSAGAAANKNAGFLAFRITQPTRFNNFLTPPFTQVLVQARQPVPGQMYNILFISVRNGTAQTFNSSNGFLVRLPGGKSFPILTGSQQWQPGQVFVFYVLTKKYYPLQPIPRGFQLDLGGRSSTLIPGPSGIFLRLKYNPTKFAKQLNHIVAFGQGAQGGLGPKFGLPDTADQLVCLRQDPPERFWRPFLIDVPVFRTEHSRFAYVEERLCALVSCIQ